MVSACKSLGKLIGDIYGSLDSIFLENYGVKLRKYKYSSPFSRLGFTSGVSRTPSASGAPPSSTSSSSSSTSPPTYTPPTYTPPSSSSSTSPPTSSTPPSLPFTTHGKYAGPSYFTPSTSTSHTPSAPTPSSSASSSYIEELNKKIDDIGNKLEEFKIEYGSNVEEMRTIFAQVFKQIYDLEEKLKDYAKVEDLEDFKTKYAKVEGLENELKGLKEKVEDLEDLIKDGSKMGGTGNGKSKKMSSTAKNLIYLTKKEFGDFLKKYKDNNDSISNIAKLLHDDILSVAVDYYLIIREINKRLIELEKLVQDNGFFTDLLLNIHQKELRKGRAKI